MESEDERGLRVVGDAICHCEVRGAGRGNLTTVSRRLLRCARNDSVRTVTKTVVSARIEVAGLCNLIEVFSALRQQPLF
jgi:hypothetical protein